MCVEKRSLVVGLTGGIGTGKSNVMAVCRSFGAGTIDADQVSREVTAPALPAYRKIVSTFSSEMLREDKTIDRRKLGTLAFADPDALAELERIIHPFVREEIQRRIEASEARVIVIEAIKLLESGLHKALCDQVWVTTCPRSQQFSRLASGRDLSHEEIRRRISAQMKPAAMIAQADRVIDTGGTLAETGLVLLGAWRDLDAGFPAPVIRTGSSADAEGIAAVLNGIVGEPNASAIDRTYTVAQERRYLSDLPERTVLSIGCVGKIVAGFQIVEPYAVYTSTMDHVATIGTYVANPARRIGLAKALFLHTRTEALAAGYRKLIAAVRSDNLRAQQFYEGLAFRRCGIVTDQVRTDSGYVDQWIYEGSLEG